MQKVTLSDEQLMKIVLLRKNGGKWLQIEKETGISRHIAKREYSAWQASQALGEMSEARKVVAAEAFRDHINYLIRIAESLAGHLRSPSFADRTISADLFLENLWETNIISSSTPDTSFGAGVTVGPARNLRENRMLFQSLIDHTRDKIDWKGLGQWKQKWDDCIALICTLRDEDITMINELFAEEEWRTPRLAARIRDDAQFDKPVEQMAGAVVTQILRRIEKNEPALFKPVARIYAEDRVVLVEEKEGIREIRQKGSKLAFGDSYQSILTFSDAKLAALAKDACNLVTPDLSLKDGKGAADSLKEWRDRVKEWRGKVQSLRECVQEIGKLKEKFNEVLDPLVLRPMILRTRCELCPA